MQATERVPIRSMRKRRALGSVTTKELRSARMARQSAVTVRSCRTFRRKKMRAAITSLSYGASFTTWLMLDATLRAMLSASASAVTRFGSMISGSASSSSARRMFSKADIIIGSEYDLRTAGSEARSAGKRMG